MDSILLSKTPDRYQGRRHFKLTDHRPIPHRYYQVLALHLAGKPCREICSLTGYKDSTIYAILADPRVIQIRQNLLEKTQEEFEALFPRVVDTLREDLFSGDPDREHKSREQWFKASGKFKGEEKGGQTNFNLTAEDIVIQILNQGKEQGDNASSPIQIQEA